MTIKCQNNYFIFYFHTKSDYERNIISNRFFVTSRNKKMLNTVFVNVLWNSTTTSLLNWVSYYDCSIYFIARINFAHSIFILTNTNEIYLFMYFQSLMENIAEKRLGWRLSSVGHVYWNYHFTCHYHHHTKPTFFLNLTTTIIHFVIIP